MFLLRNPAFSRNMLRCLGGLTGFATGLAIGLGGAGVFGFCGAKFGAAGCV
jgi:hypothetical protein